MTDDVVTQLKTKYEELLKNIAASDDWRQACKREVRYKQDELKNSKRRLYDATKEWIKARAKAKTARNKWNGYLSRIRREVKKKPGIALKMFEEKVK